MTFNPGLLPQDSRRFHKILDFWQSHCFGDLYYITLLKCVVWREDLHVGGEEIRPDRSDNPSMGIVTIIQITLEVRRHVLLGPKVGRVWQVAFGEGMLEGTFSAYELIFR